MKAEAEKLYVQYLPDREEAEWLVSLQARLKAAMDKGRPVPPAQLHVTVLHIGFVEEAYQQLLGLRPELDRLRFDAALRRFVETVKPELPSHCELKIKRLEYFGPYGSVLALALEADEAFRKAYEASQEGLQELMERLGIFSMAAIPYRPRALQVPDNMNPHLSLFKGTAHNLGIEGWAEAHPEKTLRLHLDSLG